MPLEPTAQELYLTASAQHDSGRLHDAEALYRRAVQSDPKLAEAWNDLGILYTDLGRIADAIGAYRGAIAVRPAMAEAHVNLAAALLQTGQTDHAIESCQRAISIDPAFAPAHNLLGNACYFSGRLDEAIAAYSRAIQLQPDLVDALNNLGLALHEAGQLDAAADALGRALALRPNFTESVRNLADVLRSTGDAETAISLMRQALAERPDSRLHSNLLFTLHFHPAYDRKRLFQEHVEWARIHALPLKSEIRLHPNDHSADRRLRIGYSASNLGNHPQGRLLLPLLANHDRSQFEIFCYCEGRRPDRITRQIREHTDGWRETVGLSDQQLAEVIRADRIDILVDLAMHTGANRLLTFARKPAPVQATYLGYCSTTGLDTIDFRLTDPYLDPLERDDSFYTERSVRLPSTFWCYPPPGEAPAVGPLSAGRNGAITFGCINEFSKVNPGQISLWSQLLSQLPNSSLLVHARDGSHRQRVLDQFASEEVDPHRVAFIGYVPLEKYFAAYNQIDMALDTFPYAGGTTTLDALWMGVPVVSLAGDTAVSRGGLSILSNLGLHELVATTPEQYVQIAADLARDLPRLNQLRASLRARMQASPLMNARQFARDVEAAYRQMWRQRGVVAPANMQPPESPA
jgi:predicted O-linked N-acetylglucosamine transferase (SPINDLY family)